MDIVDFIKRAWRMLAAASTGSANGEERKRLAENTERTQRERTLRVAIQLVMGEIEYGRKMIEDVVRHSQYWSPLQRTLPNESWKAQRVTLAETSETASAYRAAESAYQEFDRLNHVVGARTEKWRQAPEEMALEGFLVVRGNEDRIMDVLGTAGRAERELGEALRSIGVKW